MRGCFNRFRIEGYGSYSRGGAIAFVWVKECWMIKALVSSDAPIRRFWCAEAPGTDQSWCSSSFSAAMDRFRRGLEITGGFATGSCASPAREAAPCFTGMNATCTPASWSLALSVDQSAPVLIKEEGKSNFSRITIFMKLEQQILVTESCTEAWATSDGSTLTLPFQQERH